LENALRIAARRGRALAMTGRSFSVEFPTKCSRTNSTRRCRQCSRCRERRRCRWW
jgi:hypothetical protein